MNVEDYVTGLLDSLDPFIVCDTWADQSGSTVSDGVTSAAAEIVQHPFIFVMRGLLATSNAAKVVDSIIENEIAGPVAQHNNTGIVIEWPSPDVVIARIPTGLIDTPTKLTDTIRNLTVRIPQTFNLRRGVDVVCGVPQPRP